MTIYVYRNGKLVDKSTVVYEGGCGPYVISDEIDATRHMADGRHYTSKAKFRAATKAAGCVEVGTDAAVTRPRKPILLDKGNRRDAIKRAIYDLRNGVQR